MSSRAVPVITPVPAFGGGGYAEIGFCKVCGAPRNAMAVAGVVAGAITGAFTLYTLRRDYGWTLPLILTFIVAGVAAFGAYIGCTGIQAGIPVRQV